MGQGGRTGQHRETPLSFNPIFIKCKFSTSCSLCVVGGSQGPGEGGTERGRPPPSLLNLGLLSPFLSAQVPPGQRKSLAEGETQRAGAARILPAPRAPCDPSHCVRSQ